MATERVAQLQALCDAGMRVVDVGVTLARTGTAQPLRLEWAEPGDAEALARIAETAFTRTRFHLDPDIPDAVATAIKRDWVANALAGARGDGVLVQRRDGVAVGFLVLVKRGDDAVIDLIGVAPEHQGAGVGRTLVRGLLGMVPGAVSVGTQAANVGSIRFYERLGFGTTATVYNLHRHVA
ncbi:GNAT family N-acetyltransferase [Capillimicrobium parvum]|uniref:GNAT family N-acetyltransferase n=1 Tax=Capillimicrobium parvum TaxID=2884022 RepID=UPI00216B41BD|nr:GNAT family N-acetyltransferase [Capillimicrobium parvum]